MKTIILSMVAVLTFSLAHGQYDWTKGELVFKNGDTLKGFIKLPMISKDLIAFNGKERVKYRRYRDAKAYKFDENQVEKVIFKNSDTETAYFEYVQTSKKKKGLFKIISAGKKATLYARGVGVSASTPTYMNGTNGEGWVYSYAFNNFDEFYVLKQNEHIASPLITARISRSFRKRAIEYFSDCPALIAKLEQGIYIKEDVKEVVEEYNKCQ